MLDSYDEFKATNTTVASDSGVNGFIKIFKFLFLIVSLASVIFIFDFILEYKTGPFNGNYAKFWTYKLAVGECQSLDIKSSKCREYSYNMLVAADEKTLLLLIDSLDKNSILGNKNSMTDLNKYAIGYLQQSFIILDRIDKKERK